MSLRILHIAMGHPEFDRCGRELGHEVERIQGRDNPMGYYRLQSHILHGASLFMPDLVFIQSHETEVVFPETLDALRELGAFVVFWVGDVRDPIPAYYDRVAPHVDVIAFSNMTDVEEMRSRGHRSEYLQIAVDETFYTPGDPRERKGVVFLGNNYVGRFPESESRSKMVEAMRREFGPLFKVYGNGWGHGVTRTTPEKEREIYRGALVALNWDHFIRPYFASDRILRAQACGCVVVTQEYEGRRDEHPFAVAVTSIPNAVSAVNGLMEGGGTSNASNEVHTRFPLLAQPHQYHGAMGSRILVLTGYDDAMQELGDICLPSKRAYAERHGYDFECVREYPTDVHPSWHKLQLLKDRIDRYDAILWLDADSIVTGDAHVWDFHWHMGAHAFTILHASQDWCAPADERPSDANGVSFGNFILFNTPEVHMWLNMASQHTQYATRSICCWEQDSVNKCMRENAWFRSRVHVHWRRAFNSVHHGCALPGLPAPDPWQEGDFLIHLTNIPNRIEVAKEFAAYAASASN